MKKLAIVVSHPIQYYSPVFKLLHERDKIEIKVFYSWGKASVEKYDPGFNKKIEWDIPLLDGFLYEWAENISDKPGSHHFRGIITPGLINQIKAWQPEAILVYGWGFHSHFKIIRHFKNKMPVFFRGDSTLLDEKTGFKSLLKSIFLKWVYRHVDHAFYVGENSRQYFKKYGLKENQLTFAPHSIDNNRFAADRKQEADLLRQESGISNDEMVILFAGKLEEKKDPLLLLNAFINLNMPGSHLLFVGNGPLENQLKQKAGINPRVHFMDFQNQLSMPVIYQACNLFCLPSKGPGESWGLAINEAMACGKAILASNKVGAAASLVKTGHNGAIFEAESLLDLSKALKKLLTAPKDELTRIGAYSKELIKDWGFETQAKAIESAIINE